MSKFEQLLDYLVNEEMDKANELFHEIVVEKSRDIYENLIAEEEDEEVDEASDEEVDEAADEEEVDESADEEEEVDEAYDEETDEGYDEEADEGMEELEDSYMMDGDDEMPPQDAADDLGADAGMDNMDAPMDAEEEVKMDIKAAIEKLEQAFASLGGEGGDNMGDMGSDDDMDKPAEDMMGFSEGRRMTREYVEKVGNDWDKNSQKQQGAIVGKNTGDSMPTGENTKPPVSSGKGKPTTGATPHNILGGKGGQEGGHNTGTSPNKPSKGINPESGEKFASGIHNVDNKKSGVKTLSKVAGGHGAEKKGAGPGPVGSGTGDKAGQTSVGVVKSPLNGAPGRNA